MSTDVNKDSMQPIVRRPVRHQRSRQAGSRLPYGVVCVTRPGKWGNPFKTAEQFEIVMRKIFDGRSSENMPCNLGEFADCMMMARAIDELRGKNLACWCALDKPCHADVLIEFANRVI